MDGNFTEIKNLDTKSQHKKIIANIGNLTNKNQAIPLIGKKIYIKKKAIPQLKNEYYWSDLEGLQVINEQQEIIGKIAGYISTGAHDVMRVSNKNGEILIPWVMDVFIKNVDIVHTTVYVDWELC
jgi:16S rRNA processing protein RimM